MFSFLSTNGFVVEKNLRTTDLYQHLSVAVYRNETARNPTSMLDYRIPATLTLSVEILRDCNLCNYSSERGSLLLISTLLTLT